jgi:hypothetical protein
MKSLRIATDIMGVPIGRDTRCTRLLAARRRPIGGVNRKAIIGGHCDVGNVLGAFRDGRGSLIAETFE